jgi:hypothetical protein
LVNDVPGKLIQLYCLADATSAAIGRFGPELGKNGAPLVSRIACHWAALLMEMERECSSLSVLQACLWRGKSSPLKNEHVDPSWLENEQIKYFRRYYRFKRSLIPWPLTGTSVPAAADCQLHLCSTAGIRENKAFLADHGPPSLLVSQRCG